MTDGEIGHLLDELDATTDTDPDAALLTWAQLTAHPDWPALPAATRVAALDDAAAAYAGAGAGNLDRAATMAQEAFDAIAPDDPDRPYWIAMLARRVRERYETAPHAGDLVRLVELSRAAVEGSAPGTPELTLRLTALGGALRLHYAACGDLAELDEAVQVLRRARELAAVHHADPAPAENNLAVVLSDRYDRTGDLADLEEASAVALNASEKIDPADSGLSRLQNLLAALHLDRYERSGRAAELDLSITSALAAVTGAHGGSPELPGYLNNLGNAYRLRFEATLAATDWHSPGAVALDVRDLRGSIEAHRRAVELAPPDSPDRPKFLTNLGNILADSALVSPLRAALTRRSGCSTMRLRPRRPGRHIAPGG